MAHSSPVPVVDAFLRGEAEVLAALCVPDVLVDMNVPQWRFRLRGREAVRRLLVEQEFLPGRVVAGWRSVPTSDGHLVELEAEAPLEGETRKWREIVWFRGPGDTVREIVAYCTGIWDAGTIARHDAEAPLLAP